MAGFKIVVTIPDSTLPGAEKKVVLTGVAAEMTSLLSQYYADVSIVTEETVVTDATGVSVYEMNASATSPYNPVYGGS